MKQTVCLSLCLILIPLISECRLRRPDYSYEDQIHDEVDQPSREEIFGDYSKAPMRYEEDDRRFVDALCDPDDDSCSDSMLKEAPDERSPAEKIKDKLRKERDYEDAMKQGEEQAKKDLKAAGGPDPWGGLLLPHLEEGMEEDGKKKRKGGSKGEGETVKKRSKAKKSKSSEEE